MKIILYAALLSALALVSGGSALAQDRQSPMTEDKQKKLEMDGTIMAMSSKHMDMGPHMRMTEMRRLGPGDQQRADEIVRRARQAIEKYKDYKAAAQDGYQIFLPDEPQSMYHFNNSWYAMEADYRFNPEHPTSLLYEKVGDGYRLIGVMYTAPANMTEDELNKRIPLSIAQWHQHVNLCLPPRGQLQGLFDPTSRFGVNGSITTRAECERAGGRFFPRLFGWMVHLYPYEQKKADMWSVERQLAPDER